MTQETAKEHLELIIALANGKKIQHLAVFGWEDLDDPKFYNGKKYRVKPDRFFALFNESTKQIQYLCDNEEMLFKFDIPCGWEKVELIKFSE